MSQRRIRVLVADDHAVVRMGFRLLLEGSSDIYVLGESDSGEDAVHRFAELNPDVMVMDISMPGIGGLEAIERIHAKEPALPCFFHQPVDDGVNISPAPGRTLTIHFSHSVFAAAARTNAETCQQPMKVRAGTKALNLFFFRWAHGASLSSEVGGSFASCMSSCCSKQCCTTFHSLSSPCCFAMQCRSSE